MSEWISVDDRVPIVNDGYMTSPAVKVKTSDGLEYAAHYSRISGFGDYEITHWQPVIDTQKEN